MHLLLGVLTSVLSIDGLLCWSNPLALTRTPRTQDLAGPQFRPHCAAHGNGRGSLRRVDDMGPYVTAHAVSAVTGASIQGCPDHVRDRRDPPLHYGRARQPDRPRRMLAHNGGEDDRSKAITGVQRPTAGRPNRSYKHVDSEVKTRGRQDSLERRQPQ